MFRLAYNTNGLAHHRLVDALRLLAELGYEGVAITPDVGQLDLYRLDPVEVGDARQWAEELGLELAVETGARFLLDARRKHRPNLLEPEPAERERRQDFLLRSIDLAAELEAGVVSLWSGTAPSGAVADAREGPRGDPGEVEAAWDRLCQGVEAALVHARERDVRLAFEPEPGMFVERPEGYGELVRRLGAAGDELGLCLDVGHLLCTGDLPVGAAIERWSHRLVHVHLDDVRAGVHEHRMFGTGDLDLPEALGALVRGGYSGLAAVELSRDSHRGADAASEALEHLRTALARLA
jgi:sugar phosphate isomerase/epimerase